MAVNNGYAVDIRGLSKSFRRRTITGRKGYSTLKSAILSCFSKKAEEREASTTVVIRDLTLRIPKGASVGLIGRNGCGKSTFLKLITGIYKPDKGVVSVNGRLAALIELGAGFHPDFSGRENLYLGGVMHGLSRAEIDARFDEIVHFAELEQVIDDPVRTYSSGMFMRLGFSLAVHTDPDVLLVDEVLAVGDAAFVSKCKDKIAALRKAGKTLVLVTHDLDAVERWCDEALWLHGGEVKDRGEPRRVIDKYRSFVEHGEEEELKGNKALQEIKSPDTVAKEEALRWGSREIEIVSARLLSANGEQHFVFHTEDSALIEIEYQIREKLPVDIESELVFGISLNRTDGLVAHGTNTEIERFKLPALKSGGVVAYKTPRLGLVDGTYTLDVAVHRKDGYPYDYHKGIVKFAVRSAIQYAGTYVPPHTWEVAAG